MSRYTRTPVTSGYEVQSQLNQNFSDIQTAIEDTLSRVGDTPNHMITDLDMNSYRLYNLPYATSNTEPVTYAQWLAGASATTVSGFFKWTATATAGQTLFSGITPTYTQGANNIDVYINGVYQHPGAYTETSSSSITFSSGLDAGDAVLVNIQAVQALDTLTTVARVERKIATAAQTLFTLTTLTYNVGANNLSVYVNGLRMTAGVDYTETSSSSVTFASGLALNDEVVFVTGEVTDGALASDSAAVTYQYSASSQIRTVKAALQERVSVKDFGAVGDGVTDDTAAIQAAINSLVAGQTLDFVGLSYKVSGLSITNKTRIKLKGSKAKVFLSGASSTAFIFELIGTIDDLEISGFDLAGDNNSGYSQTAIGCYSGQTISNTRFHSNVIHGINVGISHNADLSGTWDKGECYDNYLYALPGVNPGQGYGLHTANATNIVIRNNIIENASRHAIYLGKGTQSNILCTGNLVKGHRRDVAAAVSRSAIECTRISDVTISNNKFIDCYDCQVNIGHDTSTSRDCYNILVTGNTFTNRKNAVPCILIGEQLVPTTNITSRVVVTGNTFEEDSTVATGATIRVWNGKNISISDNTLYRYNTAASLAEFAELGYASYISSDSHISDLVVKNNTCWADASVASTRAVYITNQLCTGSSPYTIKDNTIKGFASEFYFPVSPTNANSKLKFRDSYVTDYASLAANTVATSTHTINGVKSTSMVSLRPQNSIGPNLSFQCFASDSATNTIVVWRQNPTGSAIDMGSQTYYVFVEDL